MNKIQKLN